MWNETMRQMQDMSHFRSHFPWLFPIFEALPRSLIGYLNPGVVLILAYQDRLKTDVSNIINGKYSFSPEADALGIKETIFHSILASDELPAAEKRMERMWQEGVLVIGAGVDTTANALTTMHVHLLENPDVVQKLREELAMALPDKYGDIKLAQVEGLKYMTAVINEGLRLSYGVSSRLQRISPYEPLYYKSWIIPPGTPVGMSSVHIHQDPTIFPDPMAFKPSRWLEQNSDRPLERYLVNFSKGNRSCIGINLAKAEIYLTLATVFRKYEEQKLFECGRYEVDMAKDCFVPLAADDAKEVRVVFG